MYVFDTHFHALPLRLCSSNMSAINASMKKYRFQYPIARDRYARGKNWTLNDV